MATTTRPRGTCCWNIGDGREGHVTPIKRCANMDLH